MYNCAGARSFALFFTFDDGTTRNLPDKILHGGCCEINNCDGGDSTYVPNAGTLPGRFKGLSFFRIPAGSDWKIDERSWSIWYDSTPSPHNSCSQIKVTNTPSTSMTITLFAGPSTSNLTFGYTLGPGGTSCAGSGATYALTYTDPTTLPSFLSYTKPTFTGLSTAPPDIGLYTINFFTDIYPFDRSELETSFTVVVTCVH